MIAFCQTGGSAKSTPSPLLVAACAAQLEANGVTIVAPVTDQPWRHCTLFVRDPDGNVIEIFAEL